MAELSPTNDKEGVTRRHANSLIRKLRECQFSYYSHEVIQSKANQMKREHKLVLHYLMLTLNMDISLDSVY